MVKTGAERQTKHKTIPAKEFSEQNTCKCVNGAKPKPSCSSKIDVERQCQIFTAYKGMNWTQKTLFLRKNVDQRPVKSRISDLNPIIPLKYRQFNYTYSLMDRNDAKQVVCRDFFLQCLQASGDRVRRAVNSTDKNPTAAEKRGKNKNKKFAISLMNMNRTIVAPTQHKHTL